MTAGRVWGVELSSRGGWLNFALIWTQAGGAGCVVERQEERGGLGGEGKTCPAPPQWQPCLPLLYHWRFLSFRLTVGFPCQDRIQLFWSANHESEHTTDTEELLSS